MNDKQTPTTHYRWNVAISFVAIITTPSLPMERSIAPVAEQVRNERLKTTSFVKPHGTTNTESPP